MNLSVAIPYLNPVYTHQPLSFATSRLLRGSNISFDLNLLEEKLLEHPYFPSLLSISDALSALGVAHQAYKTDITTLATDFARPVLVSLKMQGGLFAVVEQVHKGKVKVLTEKGDAKEYTVEAFTQVWDGIVLELGATEGGLKVKPPGQKEAYPSFVRYGLFAFILFVTIYLLQRTLSSNSPVQISLLLLNITGLTISWLLVLQHLNKNNALVRQLCQSKTQEGCDSVLSSSTSQLTPWLSMAEAGLMYFAGTTCLLLFFSAPALYFYLAFAAPVFSLYAIYLQAVVIKQWCRLCMTVHGVLIVNFGIAFWFYGSFPSQFALPNIPQVIAFLLPALVWMMIKPFIKHLREGTQYKQEYKRLKSNPELFNALLQKQQRVHIPEEIKVFSFGNMEAEHELVFVSNPYCAPCARAHDVIHDWLDSELDFRITIVFIHQTDKNDKKRQFAELISGVENKEALQYILNDWFGNGRQNVEQWAGKHQLVQCPLKYDEERLRHWLDMTDVSATPTFFVNGYRLPDNYRLEDIRYLVSEVQ